MVICYRYKYVTYFTVCKLVTNLLCPVRKECLSLTLYSFKINHYRPQVMGEETYSGNIVWFLVNTLGVILDRPFLNKHLKVLLQIQ